MMKICGGTESIFINRIRKFDYPLVIDMRKVKITA